MIGCDRYLMGPTDGTGYLIFWFCFLVSLHDVTDGTWLGIRVLGDGSSILGIPGGVPGCQISHGQMVG